MAPREIADEERSSLEELALLLTEREHRTCGLSADGLRGLSSVLGAPALDAYIDARLNGLCEAGATEVFTDTFVLGLRTRGLRGA